MKWKPLTACATLTVALSVTGARADPTALAPLAADSTNSFLPVPAVDVVFEASEADKRLTGRVGFVLRDLLAIETKVSSPVSDSGDPVAAITIDGLEAGTSLEVAVAYIRWNPDGNDAEAKKVCLRAAKEANAQAIKELEEKIAKHEAPSFSCTVTSLPEALQDEFKAKDAGGRDDICIAHRKKLNEDELQKLQKQLQDLNAAAPDPAKPFVCVRSALRPEYRSEFDDAIDYGLPLVLGIRGKVDKKSYKFADVTTLESKKEKHNGLSIGAFAGLLLDRNGALAAAVRWERSYEEGDKATFCLPGSVTGTLLCNERALGAPKEKDRWVAAVSYQRTLGKSVGAVARVGVDLSNSVVLAELPIFFLAKAESSFTGGIVLAASYTTEGSDIQGVASVFLGGRFDVLGVDTKW